MIYCRFGGWKWTFDGDLPQMATPSRDPNIVSLVLDPRTSSSASSFSAFVNHRNSWPPNENHFHDALTDTWSKFFNLTSISPPSSLSRTCSFITFLFDFILWNEMFIFSNIDKKKPPFFVKKRHAFNKIPNEYRPGHLNLFWLQI